MPTLQETFEGRTDEELKEQAQKVVSDIYYSFNGDVTEIGPADFTALENLRRELDRRGFQSQVVIEFTPRPKV